MSRARSKIARKTAINKIYEAASTNDENIDPETNNGDSMNNKDMLRENAINLNTIDDFEKIDVEAILNGDYSCIPTLTSLDDLFKAKEQYKAGVKKILNEKKKEFLCRSAKRRNTLVAFIPDEVKAMPLICLLIALKNNYAGEKIVVKNKIDAVKKKPSVIVKMGDQTIIIEGSDIKVNGNRKNNLNINFINDIKSLYNDYYGGKQK